LVDVVVPHGDGKSRFDVFRDGGDNKREKEIGPEIVYRFTPDQAYFMRNIIHIQKSDPEYQFLETLQSQLLYLSLSFLLINFQEFRFKCVVEAETRSWAKSVIDLIDGLIVRTILAQQCTKNV
jgi:hypothetical protein